MQTDSIFTVIVLKKSINILCIASPLFFLPYIVKTHLSLLLKELNYVKIKQYFFLSLSNYEKSNTTTSSLPFNCTHLTPSDVVF